MIQRELGKVLLKCEELQERQIEETLKPKLPAEVDMPEAEREAALSHAARSFPGRSASWTPSRPLAWSASRSMPWSVTWPAFLPEN